MPLWLNLLSKKGFGSGCLVGDVSAANEKTHNLITNMIYSKNSINLHKEYAMGIVDLVEEAGGIFAAEKALEAVDPEAGFLAKAAAAVAGYKGVEAVKEHLDDGDDSTEQTNNA